jgi:dihydrofolate synthase/folylpolyglutamate synthase
MLSTAMPGSRRDAASSGPPSKALAYLASRTHLGIKFGLETIRALVAALGHPERAYPTLLVAGTNGKGSVVAYADAVLRRAGLRVGRYTSPHLVRLSERIVVDGREIAPRDLERAVGCVREVAERLVAAGRIRAHPTFFEAVTAAAFEHFRARRVDVAVVEVGLGGRLDATNVTAPLASAIVSLDYDHQEFLGETLDAIAREKAGVVRRARPVVVGPVPAEARSAIEQVARRRRARLVDACAGTTIAESARGLTLTTPSGRYRGLRPLAGLHQRANLVVALRLLEEARRAGLRFDLSRAAPAVSRARWPGRLQRVPGRPPLLLDGAHNPAGARALADHLRGLGRFVLLFGVMRDKNVPGIAGALFPLASAIVLTQPRIERAASPGEIRSRAALPGVPVHDEPDVRAALARARALAGPDATVVVAGSLYLVGEVLEELRAATPPSKP